MSIHPAHTGSIARARQLGRLTRVSTTGQGGGNKLSLPGQGARGLFVALLLVLGLVTPSLAKTEYVMRIKLRTLGNKAITLSTVNTVFLDLCFQSVPANQVMYNASKHLANWAAINPKHPEALEWSDRYDKAWKVWDDANKDRNAVMLKTFEVPGNGAAWRKQAVNCPDYEHTGETSLNLQVWRLSQ